LGALKLEKKLTISQVAYIKHVCRAFESRSWQAITGETGANQTWDLKKSPYIFGEARKKTSRLQKVKKISYQIVKLFHTAMKFPAKIYYEIDPRTHSLPNLY